MVLALNLNSVREFPTNNQSAVAFKQAEKEPAQLLSMNKAENDGKVKAFASEIKNTNDASTPKTKKEAEEKLQDAIDKLEKAQENLDEKQKKLMS